MKDAAAILRGKSLPLRSGFIFNHDSSSLNQTMPRIGAPPTGLAQCIASCGTHLAQRKLTPLPLAAQKLISKTVFKRTIPSTQSTRHRDTLTTTTRRVRTLTHTSHDQPSLDIVRSSVFRFTRADVARTQVEKEAYVLAEQHEPDHKEMRPTEVAQWVSLGDRGSRAGSLRLLSPQHGHKPGRGAVIDEQLQAEDLEELKRKGRA